MLASPPLPPSSPKPDGSTSPSGAGRVRNLFSSLRRSSKPRQANESRSPTPGSASPRFGALEHELGTTSPPLPPQRIITRNTPPWELPQTWDEWNDAYAAGLVSFDDPPKPAAPLEDAHLLGGIIVAPRPPNEQQRQRTVKALDITHGLSDFVLGESDPSKHPLHPALMQLTQEAKERFGVEAVAISLIDADKQTVLSEVGYGLREFPRDASICQHSVLKASTQSGQTSPLVVLDFTKDIRFCQNTCWGPYSNGFYAGGPILLPATLGDNSQLARYPAGMMCILDTAPRSSFSQEDIDALMDFSARAAKELLGWQRSQEQERRTRLNKKHEEWRRSRQQKVIERRPPSADGLPSIQEGRPLQTMSSSEQLKHEMDVFAASGRRPSLTPSLSPSGSSSFSNSDPTLGTTDVAPLFRSRRRKTQNDDPLQRYEAQMCDVVSEDERSIVSLSTRLVGESLDLSFTCLCGVALDSTSGPTSRSKLWMVSHHNIPIPGPLFDVTQFFPLVEAGSTQSARLFVDADLSTRAEGTEEFATGLVVRVGESRVRKTDGLRVAYVLCGFSEDPSLVFGSTELSFLRQFADDLSKWTDRW